MLYGLVIAINVIVSFVLIAVILLQAGKGGGLNETFGGSSTQTILGTKTSVFLTRATTVSAVLFLLTCLLLAAMTSHKGRSIVAPGGTTMPILPKGAPSPMAETPLDY